MGLSYVKCKVHLALRYLALRSKTCSATGRLGMAMGKVQVGFLYILVRPASLSQKPEPGPFIKQVFFSTPNPPCRASVGLAGPVPSCPTKPKIRNTNFNLWFYINPNTNTNTNPNTITNINTEILNTNVRSMIFPFKITNQTQILDLWFSLSKSQTQTHIETNWT